MDEAAKLRIHVCPRQTISRDPRPSFTFSYRAQRFTNVQLTLDVERANSATHRIKRH
jgi:hypothetical protein